MTGRTTTTQEALRVRARKALAGGVSSNIRMLNPHLIVDRGAGSRLWDVDGNEFIDYVLGQGPNFLGYAPEEITSKVLAAQQDGVVYAATHRIEVEAAEKVLSILTWADTMRFGSSSSEMVQAALRLARYSTGRTRILRFHGHYHGWFDNINTRTQGDVAVPASGGQLPQALNEVVTIDWNDLEAFERTVRHHGDDLAAVIMEPIMLNAGTIEPLEGYLQAVRKICSARGIVLIFDETISGFRLSVGGAAQRFDVYPDLAVYGKAIAAGWPCAALVGSRALFEGVASGEVVHAGTFNGSTLATAATLACLQHIENGDVHREVERVGGSLMTSLSELLREHGAVVQGLPMAFHVRFDDTGTRATNFRQLQNADTEKYARFSRALYDNGIWVASRGIWYVSAAHDDKDVTETTERVADVLRELD